MAGGKETPRQKMIGMMYLVLTALLALQISNAVLEKFIFINSTLEGLAKESTIKNNQFVATIKTEVDKNPQHKSVLAKAEELRGMTSKLSEDFSALKERMIFITGGYEEGYDGNKMKIAGAKDYDKVGTMMLQQKEGKEFESALDDYVASLNKIVKDLELTEYGIPGDFPELTKSGKEMEAFKDDPDQNIKDFLTITFENTPTAAGMASVSQLEAEMLEYEKQVLTAMAAKVGAAIVNFDVIVPMVKPNATRIPIGSKYEADLFVVASSSSLNPKMEVNGQSVTVETQANGLKMGKVSINAGSVGKHSFKTAITMNDTTFNETYEYEVFAPTVTYSSAGATSLYAKCANTLSVQCPDLGENYNPSFSVTNADKKVGSKKGEVKIIPNSLRVVTLSTSSGGVAIGKQTFTVKQIPQPSVQVFDRTNKRADNVPSVSASAASVLNVSVVPEGNFAKEVPEDARYVLQSGMLTVSGAAPKRFSGPRINVAGVRPGQSITIQLDKVVRRRYDGSTEDVKLDQRFVTLRVN